MDNGAPKLREATARSRLVREKMTSTESQQLDKLLEQPKPSVERPPEGAHGPWRHSKKIRDLDNKYYPSEARTHATSGAGGR